MASPAAPTYIYVPTASEQASGFAGNFHELLQQNKNFSVTTAKSDHNFLDYVQKSLEYSREKKNKEHSNWLSRRLGWLAFVMIVVGFLALGIGLAMSIAGIMTIQPLVLTALALLCVGGLLSIPRLYQYYRKLAADNEHDKIASMKMFAVYVGFGLTIAAISITFVMFPIAPFFLFATPIGGAVLLAALLTPGLVYSFKSSWAAVKASDYPYLWFFVEFPFGILYRTVATTLKSTGSFIKKYFFNRYGALIASPFLLIIMLAVLNSIGLGGFMAGINDTIFGLLSSVVHYVIHYTGLGFLVSAGCPPVVMFIGVITVLTLSIYAAIKHWQFQKAEKKELAVDYTHRIYQNDNSFASQKMQSANHLNLESYYRLSYLVPVLKKYLDALKAQIPSDNKISDANNTYLRFEKLYQQYENANKLLSEAVANKSEDEKNAELAKPQNKVYLPPLAIVGGGNEKITLNIQDPQSYQKFIAFMANHSIVSAWNIAAPNLNANNTIIPSAPSLNENKDQLELANLNTLKSQP